VGAKIAIEDDSGKRDDEAPKESSHGVLLKSQNMAKLPNIK
jgi:hypothetical protein